MLLEILFPTQISGKSLVSRLVQKIARYSIGRRFLLWMLSTLGGLRNRNLYAKIQSYCMFVGYPRSGHSLVGSLIDAHPQSIIAHELDALRYVDEDYSKNRLFYMLARNSREFSEIGRSWTGYSYEVEGQWQGRYSENLVVIGDKKGGVSTRRIREKPALFNRLENLVGIPVFVIHVVRNPFDNISTISRKHNMSLEEATDFYYSFCETISDMKRTVDPQRFLEFKLEDLVENPKGVMTRVCEFLGLSAPQDYLEACENVIFDRPKKTRDMSEWSKDLVENTLERAKSYPFLHGYDYE